ncbi:MAG: efflux RND transporter permease subunit, partial [Deltaproteobacteria bacterium]|nr:efflux RND transporter permease subunit [Deltaproteobacteria bacterium]
MESVKDTGEVFDDINLKLNSIQDLPDGAGPIMFIKDFGDTSALMMTVASPKVGEVEVELRAREVELAIRELRSQIPVAAGSLVALAMVSSSEHSESYVRRKLDLLSRFLTERGLATGARLYSSPSLAVMDMETTADDQTLWAALEEFVAERFQHSEMNPDIWDPVLVRDPAETRAKLAGGTASKYTYRDLEAYTDEIARTLQTVPVVSKVTRWGVHKQSVFLEYSQERLASYGIQPWKIKEVLTARNIALPGGIMEFGGKNLIIDPSGEFKSEKELGDTIVSATGTGAGAYLRDLVDIERGYEYPPENLNYLTYRDANGQWNRTRAITLAVNMRAGEQIQGFSREVNAGLERVRPRLPEDLIIARTSDQPRQVQESVSLFMNSLYEAVILVVLVALVGFWEWRSALLMALSIPITLAMTFGMMEFLGIDLQQVSIASLIIALGLLVDDPVVANDAIRHELDQGQPRDVAAWMG